jgi:hypothetical protein
MQNGSKGELSDVSSSSLYGPDQLPHQLSQRWITSIVRSRLFCFDSADTCNTLGILIIFSYSTSALCLILLSDSWGCAIHSNLNSVLWRTDRVNVLFWELHCFNWKSYFLKMANFWVVTPCSQVEVYRSFRGACCLHSQCKETSVNFYQTTRRNNPEVSHLHTRRRENRKHHSFSSAQFLMPCL